MFRAVLASWPRLAEAGTPVWQARSKTVVMTVAPHLRTGVTESEREPAFAAGFDGEFTGKPEEEARLRGLLRGYVEGPGRA